MSYSTQLDIINTELTKNQLVQLTDDDNRGQIDTAKVTAAILKADTEINGYLSGRYTVPVSAPVPDEIMFLSAVIAAYYLCRRRSEVTESVLDKHRKALARLKAIKEGKFSVNGLTPAADTSIESTTEDERQVFTRTRVDADGNVTKRGTMDLW